LKKLGSQYITVLDEIKTLEARQAKTDFTGEEHRLLKQKQNELLNIKADQK